MDKDQSRHECVTHRIVVWSRTTRHCCHDNEDREQREIDHVVHGAQPPTLNTTSNNGLILLPLMSPHARGLLRRFLWPPVAGVLWIERRPRHLLVVGVHGSSKSETCVHPRAGCAHTMVELYQGILLYRYW